MKTQSVLVALAAAAFLTSCDSNGTDVTEGTWVAEAGGMYRITGSPSELVLELLDNEALVDPLLIWQRAP